jgi:hypothetical protein
MDRWSGPCRVSYCPWRTRSIPANPQRLIQFPTITKRMPVARVMRRWSGSCGSTSPPMTRPCMKGRVSRRAHALLPLFGKPGRRRPATPIANATAPRRTRRTSTTESSANPSIEMRAQRDAGHFSRTYMAVLHRLVGREELRDLAVGQIRSQLCAWLTEELAMYDGDRGKDCPEEVAKV